MSGKITPSAPGLQFRRDSNGPPFHSPRQPRKEKETEALLEPDSVSIGVAQSRFHEAPHRDHSGFVNAVSFSQTQDGFLRMVEQALGKMAELSVRCRDECVADSDRDECGAKFLKLQQLISDIGTRTFNGLSLFSRTTLRVADDIPGASAESEPLEIESQGFGEDLLAAYNPRTTAVSDGDKASVALANIEKALQGLSELQARVSANLQRLSLSGDQLSANTPNLSNAARSIPSAGSAGTLTQSARSNILHHSDAAKMAQANAAPGAALRLLD